MITPDEAEMLAKQTMQNYVNACQCDSPQDVADVLTKLVSMCGFGMLAVTSKQEAVRRLDATSTYISGLPNVAVIKTPQTKAGPH